MQSWQDKTHSPSTPNQDLEKKVPSGSSASTRLPAWANAWQDHLPTGLVVPIADLQTKHIISQPGDPSEQEAEKVANQVMGMANSGPSIIAPPPNHPGALTSLAASTVQLSPVPAMVQRAPLEEETASTATATENAPASDAAAAESAPAADVSTAESVPETAPPEQTATPSLIVDDSVDQLAPGQMKKSDFLAQLRDAVCTTTEQALAGTIWSAAGCPWVDHWFGFYSNRDSQQVERAIRRYAPDTARVTSASDYIPVICERVRQAITVWSTTGEVTGVPEGVSTDTSGTSTGTSAASADVGTGETSSSTSGADTSSSSETVSFKGREGGARETSNPQSIQSQLGTGRSLESGVKSQMESAFSVDFSQVRVHTDAKAAGLSENLNARAFTAGRNVAFGPGEYQPGTLVGDALIAHELAHVVQQGGTSSSVSTQKEGALYKSLEEDADVSAIGAVVSLWSGAKGMLGNIAQNALPNLRSGLRLQRCTKSSKGPISKTRLTEARTNFQSQNSQLSKAEWDKIDAALGIVVKDNLDLWIAFYDYYSNHDITKMEEPQASKAKTSSLYAVTKPNSDTVVRPDILEPSFPNSKLGTLLIHEFTHTRHEQNVMGLGDYQEGDSYGIEYVLADRAGETSRKQEIINVMTNPTKIIIASQVPALQDRFRTSYATMVALYEVIDGKPPRSAPPFTTPAPLTADEARAFVAELVAKRSYSKRLQDIVAWIKKHYADFDMPI